MPTAFERIVWGRGDGRDLIVFSTDFGLIGGLICFEHSNPLYRYAVQAQGEQIHVASWPGGLHPLTSIMDATIRQYAWEGQTFVISATAVMTQEVMDASGAPEKLYGTGGGYSAVVDPSGQYVAGPEGEKVGLVIADIDLEDAELATRDVDSDGHYARPDVVRLVVDRRPQRVLEFEN